MAEITVSKLSKSFGIDEIFSDVSFHLNETDKVGIVGPNGAGKTTLFNILTGVDKEYDGNVYIKNNLKLGYMLQNTSLQSDKTIYEEMLEEFNYIYEIEEELRVLEEALHDHEDLERLERNTIRYTELIEKYTDLGGEYFESKIESLLLGMRFPKERFHDKVNTLSGGEKSRLELAKLLISDADILLLDEPTNHLDMETIEFVENLIKERKKLVVFISHDRYFLDKVANRIFLLENGRMRTYDTNYTDFINRRKKEIEVEQRAYENQQKEIERQEEIIERFANLGGSLRKRGIAQSRSRQKLLDKMKKLEKPEFFDEKMSLKFTPARTSGQDVLRVNNVTKSFDQKTLYKDISFEIYRGEKVGLIGGNGTGKTTLFKMILNKMRPDEGDVELGESVFPEYFDQEQKTLDLDKTIIDEVWDKYPYLTHYELRSYLARFMYIGDDIFKIVGDLSGGEKSRITLLELMLSDANFLLMDEPTNHLDIDSKEVLEDALNGYKATAFIISHDRYFLNKVCDKLIEIKDKGITIYNGNYDYYLTKQEKYIESQNEVSENKTQKRKDARKEREEQKQVRQFKNRAKNIEKRVSEIDAEVNALNIEFTKPEIFEDFDKTREISAKIESLNNEKEEISLEWMEILEKLDEMGYLEE
ncbi:ribosomal protection-like ABC-F family protein [Helcococcus kunzii]|uniref:ribosomal protection-like ABC-F family protein n=1 Tax=Helcococcus kunzii TaxID=40091 RepID=UPI0021A7C14C|nr:ATP-binding cassette domain-containing protein [Helcococcus kunzii]MCT1796608.1 ATP-binding cassette domain-containing protein [Helcococcus kunzii]MCT1988748.1 ATP-binding cassette domain-containing protein [Helcococcus kunzii]